MRTYNRPGCDEHVSAHGEFSTKVADLGRMLDTGKSGEAAKESCRFVRTWIVRHVLVADQLVWTMPPRVSVA